MLGTFICINLIILIKSQPHLHTFSFSLSCPWFSVSCITRTTAIATTTGTFTRINMISSPCNSPWKLKKKKLKRVTWNMFPWSLKVKFTQSCPTLRDPQGLYSPWNFPGQKTGVGSLFLLQGLVPTQGSNPDLPHCRQIFHQLSHKGRPHSSSSVIMSK